MSAIKSKTELAGVCGVHRSTLYQWLNDPAFPARTATGWPKAAVLAYSKRKLAEAAKHQTGENSDLKRMKLQKQCALLDVELKRAELARESEALELSIQQALTVERSVMIQHVTALCQIIQDAFAQAVALTKVQTGDARMVKIMENVRNETLKRIKNEIEAA